MNTRLQTIFRTLLFCLCASSVISIAKIFYGRQSGSLAFVSDGIHSLFDSLATILGMWSISASVKPPDKEHPYGHYKFETLASLALGVLLILAAHEVGTTAVDRILHPQAPPQFSLWGIVILGVTLIINLTIARYEAKVAKSVKSQFLTSDSLHNQSDFLITLGVLATIFCTKYGLVYVDAIASIIISFYLVALAVRLALTTLKPLTDHSVIDTKRVEEIACSIEGVKYCHQIRSRGLDSHYFLDLNIHLPGNITLSKAHEIAHQVEAKLKTTFPELVDVVIHTEPHNHPPCQPSRLYNP